MAVWGVCCLLVAPACQARCTLAATVCAHSDVHMPELMAGKLARAMCCSSNIALPCRRGVRCGPAVLTLTNARKRALWVIQLAADNLVANLSCAAAGPAAAPMTAEPPPRAPVAPAPRV
jgi:hypothetical protein